MNVFHFNRVRTRVLLVPFNLPPTGPTTADECEAFEKFEDSVQAHVYSSAVGWLISQGQVLVSEGKSVIAEIRCRLKDSFGLKSRNTLGWSICLFFASQVR